MSTIHDALDSMHRRYGVTREGEALMSGLRWNPDCPTCRKMSPVQIEQTRAGGDWRIRVEGRTVAHATRKADAARLARWAHSGLRRDAR